MTLAERIHDYYYPPRPSVAYGQIWRTTLGLGLVVWTCELSGRLTSVGLLIRDQIYEMDPIDLAMNSTLDD